jgi:hypothetical protein
MQLETLTEIGRIASYNQRTLCSNGGHLTLDLLPRLFMVRPNGERVLGTCPMDASRRFNDTFAATYCGYVAFLQPTGDDAINHLGHHLEVKLVGIDSSMYSLGAKGGLVHGREGSFGSAHGAIFHIYGGTDLENKRQDTALILYSKDHGAFIDGFIMDGDTVYEHLSRRPVTGTGGCTRFISVAQFQQDGRRFSSAIPHIGLSNYLAGLKWYLHALDDRLDDSASERAYKMWDSLLEYSKRL